MTGAPANLPPTARATPPAPAADAPVLSIRGLTVSFGAQRGQPARRVVDDLSLDLFPGQTTALVGESGSGKSITAFSAIGLPPAGARVEGGRVLLAPREPGGPAVDVLASPPPAQRALRGRDIAMIFQEPMSALNPVLTIGEQVVEAVRRAGVPAREAWARAGDALDEVGIPDAATRLRQFPHEFSGGMRQRVLIAMALAAGPRVLLADEPTTALDAHVRARVLALIDRARAARLLGVLLITHDLILARQFAHHVGVMYRGRLVERGPAARVLASPMHPYTRSLLRCQPGERTFKQPLSTSAELLRDAAEFAPVQGRRPWWRPDDLADAAHPPPAYIEVGPGHVLAVEP
ncbi:MAG: ABC transporter ATP-binding protein [Planctomycetota bacterium]|nr:ABC transporter ATP-binding protein [Planctomycetota bacterium]